MFEIGGIIEEVGLLVGRRKTHHPLHSGPIVPRTVEDHDLTGGGQMLDIALEPPQALIPVRRLGQSDDAGISHRQMFDNAFDRAVLARRVTPLKQDDDLAVLGHGPDLHVDQLNLKVPQIGVIGQGGSLFFGRFGHGRDLSDAPCSLYAPHRLAAPLTKVQNQAHDTPFCS